MGWKMRNGSIPYPENAVPMPAFGCFANAAELREVHYKGTTTQWQSVNLGVDWNANAPFTHIVCVDGQVSSV